MRHIVTIILTILFIGCSVSTELNRTIDKSQRNSIKNSPFQTATGMKAELKMQKKYRENYLTDLKEMIQNNSNDTIILTEGYDFICFGCPADYIQIFIKDTLILYRKDLQDKAYEQSKKVLADYFVYSNIAELRQEIRNGSQWNNKPEKYGTDECHDGGHTFYTVFYPSGKIESMYMRCWTPKEFRKEK
jgi:hypothetical protein